MSIKRIQKANAHIHYFDFKAAIDKSEYFELGTEVLKFDSRTFGSSTFPIPDGRAFYFNQEEWIQVLEFDDANGIINIVSEIDAVTTLIEEIAKSLQAEIKVV